MSVRGQFDVKALGQAVEGMSQEENAHIRSEIKNRAITRQEPGVAGLNTSCKMTRNRHKPV
jgi:hypothetical protein